MIICQLGDIGSTYYADKKSPLKKMVIDGYSN